MKTVLAWLIDPYFHMLTLGLLLWERFAVVARGFVAEVLAQQSADAVEGLALRYAIGLCSMHFAVQCVALESDDFLAVEQQAVDVA